jgi:hypothetical protein
VTASIGYERPANCRGGRSGLGGVTLEFGRREVHASERPDDLKMVAGFPVLATYCTLRLAAGYRHALATSFRIQLVPIIEA